MVGRLICFLNTHSGYQNTPKKKEHLKKLTSIIDADNKSQRAKNDSAKTKIDAWISSRSTSKIMQQESITWNKKCSM